MTRANGGPNSCARARRRETTSSDLSYRTDRSAMMAGEVVDRGTNGGTRYEGTRPGDRSRSLLRARYPGGRHAGDHRYRRMRQEPALSGVSQQDRSGEGVPGEGADELGTGIRGVSGGGVGSRG